MFKIYILFLSISATVYLFGLSIIIADFQSIITIDLRFNAKKINCYNALDWS